MSVIRVFMTPLIYYIWPSQKTSTMLKNYFKYFVLSFAILIGMANATGQIFNPVKWEYKSTSLGNNEFELEFIATIDAHWHLYTQHIGEPGPNGAPIPTGFFFKESADFELIGETTEDEGISIHDVVFDMELKYFEDKAIFKQKVRILNENVTISGDMEYMSCDDSKCLPPEFIPFSFELKGEPVSHDNENGIFTPVKWTTKIVSLGDDEYELQAVATIDEHWHVYSMSLPNDDGPVATEFVVFDSTDIEFIGGSSEKGELIEEFDPNFQMDLKFYSNTITVYQKVKISDNTRTIKGEVYFMTCDDKMCLPPEAIELEFVLAEAVSGEGSDSKQSLWKILLLSFAGGLGALLTPCVFPMIPMTVSFFTKQSKTKVEGIKKGIFYGLSIIGIYVLLSLPFHIFDTVSPDIFNEFSTNPYLNFSFFLIFIVFAISFLGAFEITMPSSWVNKADSASDKGGLIGVFFMALTLILVSFSCTGPAIGLLLGSVLSSDGGATALSVGMLGFGLGIGLPFGLFAAFPGWLNSLPKSGGWLNTVKVVFGFVELAFAFKFLSNADLVLQAHIITREVFISIWVGVFGAMAMYLFGLFKLPHDSPLERLSVGRGIFATFTLVFVIYLLPGLWGAPLKLISGFPPPGFYSESPNGVGFSGNTMMSNSATDADIPKGTDPSHCPHNLNCFHDYETGLAYAKEVNKPVLLDFTGWACVNCRRMEENVWSDPRVLERLRNDYVLISLYVDEKANLPKEEQFTSDATGKKVKTVGNKWSEFQIRRFQSNTQPYYVILDLKENQINESAAYDPDILKFVDWLDRGMKKFQKGK